MKTMDRLYERLTPVERFQIAVAAFGREDLVEVDRLNDSVTWRTVKIQEPAYFDRLQRITWVSLFFTVQSRNLQITSLAAFSAMMIHLLQSDSRRANDEATEEDDANFDELVEICQERISRVKGLHAACVEFCAGLGLSASDINKMTGMPFMGGLGQLDLIQEIVGEVSPDAEYQRERIDDMRNFWKINLEDRYSALR